MSKKKTEDGLKALVDAKILNPNVTLSNLLEISKRLDSDDGDVSRAWSFIVKGKFIWKDDSKVKIDDNSQWSQAQ